MKLLFKNVELREIKAFINYKIKTLIIFIIHKNDVINIFYIEFKIIKRLNNSSLNILK